MVSMAKCFFDVTAPDLAHSLFAQSKLSQEHPDFVASRCGQFPVISVSFGKCSASSWEKMEALLRGVLSQVYQDHRYLIETPGFLYDDERRKFQAILDEDPSALYEFALERLTALLRRYHKKRVIVLIDEYDQPVKEAFENEYFKEAITFLRSAFTGCLKDNPYSSLPIPIRIIPCAHHSLRHLEKGLLTGVLRVAKAGFLSGLNNLRVYSLLNPQFADKYGVTEAEMQEALAFEDLSTEAGAVRDYYDGYDTALPDVHLYNPWSTLNYLQDKKIDSYWVETGKTDFIAKAMWSGPLEMREMLNTLLDGGKLIVPVQVDLDFNSLTRRDTLWSLLYFAGYVTGRRMDGDDSQMQGDDVEIRVPNREVSGELAKMWSRAFSALGVGAEYDKCILALLQADPMSLERELNEILLRIVR